MMRDTDSSYQSASDQLLLASFAEAWEKEGVIQQANIESMAREHGSMFLSGIPLDVAMAISRCTA